MNDLGTVCRMFFMTAYKNHPDHAEGHNLHYIQGKRIFRFLQPFPYDL